MKMTPIYTMMLAAGLTACGGESQQDAVVGGKTLSLVDENTVGVSVGNDAIAGFLSHSAIRSTVYLLQDSAVITKYYPCDEGSFGGQTRFWKNGEFTKAEQTEFQQAKKFADQKLGR